MLYQVPTGHEKSARGERSRSEKIQRRRGPAGWSLRWVNALCVLFFVLQMSAGQKTIQCQGKPAIDLTAELKRFDEPRLKLLLDFFAAHFLRWSTIRWSWITHFLTLMLFGQNNNINIRPGAASCMVCLTFFCPGWPSGPPRRRIMARVTCTWEVPRTWSPWWRTWTMSAARRGRWWWSWGRGSTTRCTSRTIGRSAMDTPG